MSQKSYDGKNALYLVPTPIGNLEDITMRALRILKEADIIFSEDTRVTINLLRHYDIKKSVYPLHEHNEEQVTPKVLETLEDGKVVALVSDRGTPIISDPGYKCSKEVIEKGYCVLSLPGPTALIPALTSSGIEPSPFMFYGFLNSKESKQRKELEQLKDYPFTIIFYEAPHRIQISLSVMLEILGNRHISISREITKRFEEVYRGKIDELIPLFDNPKGEFVIVVEGNKEEKETEINSISLIDEYIKQGYSEKDAIKTVSKQFNLSKNALYQQFLENNKKR